MSTSIQSLRHTDVHWHVFVSLRVGRCSGRRWALCKHKVSSTFFSSLCLWILPTFSIFKMNFFKITLTQTSQPWIHSDTKSKTVPHEMSYSVSLSYHLSNVNMTYFHYHKVEHVYDLWVTIYIPFSSQHWEHNRFSINTHEMNKN